MAVAATIVKQTIVASIRVAADPRRRGGGIGSNEAAPGGGGSTRRTAEGGRSGGGGTSPRGAPTAPTSASTSRQIVAPNRMASPAAIARVPWTRSSFTNVPLLDPRSSIAGPPATARMAACRRETCGSVRRMSQPSRPIVAPGASGCLLPGTGVSSTKTWASATGLPGRPPRRCGPSGRMPWPWAGACPAPSRARGRWPSPRRRAGRCAS
jgi:hypothetical protein